MFVKATLWTELLTENKIMKNDRIISDLYKVAGCPAAAM
jgi:hypothetical protein